MTSQELERQACALPVFATARAHRPQAGGVKYPPAAQSRFLAPPARFASTEPAPPAEPPADPYPGPEAPQGMLHAWALSEWERLRGSPLDPALVAEALAAYADPGEGDGAEEPGEEIEDTCVPGWLRAVVNPPGWTRQEEAAHRRRWANERGAPIHRREEAGHAPA